MWAIAKNAFCTSGYLGTVTKIICFIWGLQPIDRGSNNQHDEHEFLDNNKEILDDDKGILVEVGGVISLVLGYWQTNDCNGLYIAKCVCNV